MSEQFADMAKNAFSFLENVGFRLVGTEDSRLRYQSSISVVTIDWDARSGEIEVWVGLRSSMNQPGGMYSLTDLLEMHGAAKQKMPAQVSDEKNLQPFLEQLADDLRVHGHLALVGDPLYFRRLEAFRHVEAEAFTKGLRLQAIRSEIKRAWEERDFGKVVRLCAPIESDLSEAEKKKLEYARRYDPD